MGGQGDFKKFIDSDNINVGMDVDSTALGKYCRFDEVSKISFCTECEYSSSYRHAVLRHVKGVHMKMKPYTCVKCDYSTTYKHRILTHDRTKHLNEGNNNINQQFNNNMNQPNNNVNNNMNQPNNITPQNNMIQQNNIIQQNNMIQQNNLIQQNNMI